MSDPYAKFEPFFIIAFFSLIAFEYISLGSEFLYLGPLGKWLLTTSPVPDGENGDKGARGCGMSIRFWISNKFGFL